MSWRQGDSDSLQPAGEGEGRQMNSCSQRGERESDGFYKYTRGVSNTGEKVEAINKLGRRLN